MFFSFQEALGSLFSQDVFLPLLFGKVGLEQIQGVGVESFQSLPPPKPRCGPSYGVVLGKG